VLPVHKTPEYVALGAAVDRYGKDRTTANRLAVVAAEAALRSARIADRYIENQIRQAGEE
jgi:hypothetical protein